MNRRFLVGAFGVLVACSSADTGSSTSSTSSTSSSGGGTSSSGGASSSSGTTQTSSSGSSGEALAACGVTKIEPVVGEPSCTTCMATKCCAELLACDGDELCLYCIDHKLDDPTRCVDEHTFEIYAPNKAIGTCQTDKCVPPCGAKGGSTCGPGSSCVAGCPGYPNCN